MQRQSENKIPVLKLRLVTSVSADARYGDCEMFHTIFDDADGEVNRRSPDGTGWTHGHTSLGTCSMINAYNRPPIWYQFQNWNFLFRFKK